MSCEAISEWTFNGLVGAFLDLGIAYCLLSASTLALFASKFLDLFGLCLPCPCDGLFWKPSSGNLCVQSVLVNHSSEKISSVQFSVKGKFPFDSIWNRDPNPHMNLKFGSEKNEEDEVVELERKASEDTERDFVEVEESDFAMNLYPSKEQGSFDIKGKRVGSQRARRNLRRRRRNGLGYGKFMSVPSNGILELDVKDAKESRTYNNLHKRDSLGLELSDHVDGNDYKCLSAEELGYNFQGGLNLDQDERNMIEDLEHALEEEHNARDALYLELEKERSAAATAADEAMAMILRLQEEKALIEMEARQYQRIIEEKTAYDAEEMNILKEILMRRERELHFLENEVDFYRQMVFSNDRGEATPKQLTFSSLYRSEEKSVVEKQKVKDACTEYEVPFSSVEPQNLTPAFGEELPIPQVDEVVNSMKHRDIHMNPSIEKNPHLLSSDEINNEFQEKGIVSEDENPENTKVCDESKVNFPVIIYDMEKQSKDPDPNAQDRTNSMMMDTNSHIHDVHVINDRASMSNEVIFKSSKELSGDSTLSLPIKCDSPRLKKFETKVNIIGSSLEISGGLPPTAHSRAKRMSSDMRRNSLSAVDYERSKIGNEVEWLRERLKVVQEGRDKLNNFSVGYKGKEKNQRQLLEDIARQLNEIRQLTDPGKAVRQASLPPPFSKVTSKKRRNAPLSLHSRST